MQRKSVLLPEPDGPITQTVSDLATVRSIPLSTSCSAKLLVRRRTSMIGRSVMLASGTG